MPDGFHIASAYVTVAPDTDGFYEKLQGDLERYDVKLNVPVSPDFDGFEEKLQAGVDERHASVSVPVDPDLDDFEEKLAAGVDASHAEANVPVDPDTAGFAARLQAAVDAGEAGVKGGVDVPVEPDTAGFDAQLAAVIERARVFVTSSGGVTIPVSYDVAEGSFARIAATTAMLSTDTSSAAAGMRNLGAATAGAGTAATRTYRAYGLWGVAVRAATAQTALFGGALQQIGAPAFLAAATGLHLMIDGVLELAAVIIPAVIGLAAFGAGAADAFGDIYHQMSNLNTVATALNTSIPGLGDGFSRLESAVRPEAMQLFGEALLVVNHNSGIFTQIATSAGAALDQLGARFVVAATHGNSFAMLMSDAGSDVYKLGTIVGNLGAVLGSVLQEVPGYAQVFLNLGVAFSHVAETATAAARPVIGFGLAAHGALLYTGVAATVLQSALRRVLTGVGNMAEKAGTALLATDRFGEAGVKAGSALLGLAGDADTAAGFISGKWGLAVLAAGVGLGFLIYKLETAKDAIQQFISSVAASADATTGRSIFTALPDEIQQINAKLGAFAHAAATGVVASGNMANASAHMRLELVREADALHLSIPDMARLTTQRRAAAAQAAVLMQRETQLAGSYGSLGAAQGLIIQSGVKLGDLTSKNAATAAEAMSRVLALAGAYREMGVQGGILGADMNAVNIAASDQVTAMTSVNQAWDTTIGIVSGGQTTFIAFEQGLQATAASAKAAGASMNGLNAPSLTLRASFQKAYTQAGGLMDALRMMQSASPGGFPPVARAMRDVIAQLIPLGSRSAATRAELVSLSQETGQSITNWHQLVKAFGGTRDAAGDLNKILARSGVSIQNLIADASSLTNAMSQQTNSIVSGLRIQQSGFQGWAQKVTADLSNGQKVAYSTQLGMYNSLLKAGFGARQAQALVDTYTHSLFKIPSHRNTKVTVNDGQALSATAAVRRDIAALHDKIIHIGITESVQVIGGQQMAGAGGAVLPGYAPGHDTMLVRASPGESIMVPEWTRAVGPANVMKMNRMFSGGRRSTPGSYAGGGVTTTTTGGLPEDIFNVDVNVPIRNIAIGGPIHKIGTGGSSGPVAVARSMVTVSQNLSATVSKINSEISAMKSYAKNIASSIAQSTGLGAITAPTDPTTGAAEPVTGSFIKAQLQAQLATLKKFFAAIGKLQHDKLGKTLIGQVIALGPTEGLVYADAILAGGSKLAKQLRSIESDIGAESSKIGKRAADIQYGQNMEKGFLSGLEKDKEKLKKEMKDGGKALADEVRKDLARLHIKADVSASEHKTKAGKVEVSINVKDPSGKFSAEEQAAIKRLIAQAIAAA